MRTPAAVALVLALALGCGDDEGGPLHDGGVVDAQGLRPVDGGPDAALPAEWSFETLETRRITSSERTYDVELIRAARPDGGSSYLLYVPAPRRGAPVMVVTQPYAGIDWTGEDVDARWAALGNGLRSDADAPGDVGDDVIAYEALDVQTAVDSSLVWVFNGMGVIHAFGRFYAGGSLEDDVLDSAAPYHFALSRRDEVDVTRLGAFGGSWGGMMAVYGAVRAPDGAAPRAVAALAPPTDFETLWAYTEYLPTVFPSPLQASEFFSPYRRRIEAATGGPPGEGDFSRYTASAVCTGLRSQVLLPHDEWDVLIPFEQTRDLAEACPERVEPLVWYREGDIDYVEVGLDHGLFGREPVLASSQTLLVTWLLTQLLPEGQTVYTVGAQEGLAAFLGLVRRAQELGRDGSEALPRLRELADERVQVLDIGAGAFVEGAALLARAVNDVYGTSHDAASLREALATGLPE